MNIKKYLLYSCLLAAQSAFVITADYQLPHNFTQKDHDRRTRKLALAHIQALRNKVIIQYPALLKHKKYFILEMLVSIKADDLRISYQLEQDPAHYYSKYSDDHNELPNVIKDHPLYPKYNKSS